MCYIISLITFDVDERLYNFSTFSFILYLFHCWFTDNELTDIELCADIA